MSERRGGYVKKTGKVLASPALRILDARIAPLRAEMNARIDEVEMRLEADVRTLVELLGHERRLLDRMERNVAALAGGGGRPGGAVGDLRSAVGGPYALVRTAALPTGSRVLDTGGAGPSLLLWLAASGHHVTTMAGDLVPGHPNITPRSDPPSGETFDCVVAIGAGPGDLAGIAARLRDGAVLVAAVEIADASERDTVLSEDLAGLAVDDVRWATEADGHWTVGGEATAGASTSGRGVMLITARKGG